MRKLIVIALSLLASLSMATDRYVSTTGNSVSPYTNWDDAATNIQWAINASVKAGETVWVSNGTYYLTNQINVNSNITLKSMNGPAVTIMDGGFPAYTNRVCYLNNAGAILSGFSLTNGYMITNTAVPVGVGLYANSVLLVTNCWILNNTFSNASMSFRGMVVMNNGTLSDCVISSNRALGARMDVLGVFASSAAVIITNCTMVGNTAAASPDLILISAAVGSKLVNSRIYNNNGDIWFSATGIIDSCFICDNTAGSGVQVFAPVTVRNCYIKGHGNGIWSYSKGAVIQNCTIISNTLPIHTTYSGTTPDTVDNTIMWYNTSAPDATNIVFTNCCTPNVLSGGISCITNNPLLTTIGAHTYHFNPASPCINRGINRNWMVGASDIDGGPRLRSGTVDIGAYSFQPQYYILRGLIQ